MKAMNRIVIMVIGISTVVLSVVSTFSQVISCHGPLNLDGKVKGADLIVFGCATVEGKWVPSNPGPRPLYYQQQCRIVVMEVLWPHEPSLTNDIVISLIFKTNWPASFWNYTNTTGVFFFNRTPTIAEQKAEHKKYFGEIERQLEEIVRKLPEDIRNNLPSRTVEEGPFDTNKWSRLGNWLEPATNAPMIRELIGKIKK